MLIECSYRAEGSEADGYKEGGKFMFDYQCSQSVLLFYHDVLIMIVLYLGQKPSFMHACTVPGGTAIRSFTHHCADSSANRVEVRVKRTFLNPRNSVSHGAS